MHIFEEMGGGGGVGEKEKVEEAMT